MIRTDRRGWRVLFAAALLALWLAPHASAQTTFSAVPASLGEIPDGAEIYTPVTPRDVTFTVTGVTVVQSVRVSMTFDPVHTWGSDLTATLIAPDGTSHVLFGRRGVTTEFGDGLSADLAGPYEFSDQGTLDFWTAAGDPVAAGHYRTVAAGGVGATGAPTLMDPVFLGHGGNGTWTLRLVDGALYDIGSVSAASLTLTPGPSPTTVQPATAFRVDDVSGSQVTLRWNPPVAGPAPTGYLVEGGVTPGTTLGAIQVGSVPYLSFAAPSGSFFVRVKSIDGAVVSAASNEVPLHVNVPQSPSAPTSVTGLANGQTVALSWKLTYGGGEPTGTIVDVTGAATGSLPLGPVEGFTFTGVPGGTYTFAVRATNATGASSPSSSTTLTFPAVCTGPPTTPPNFLFFRVGNTVFLLWDPPATGAAATAYQLNVTGAFTGTVPVGSARSLSAPVPSGSYSVSVTALNACGASAPTAVQTVVVP